jgi:CRP/FNR family transcriptional regulator
MGLLLDSLRSVEFLGAEGDDVVTRFMVLGKSADFTRNHVFWRAGTAPESLVVPVSGEVKTTTRSPEGREFIDRVAGTGECVGLASALDGLNHPTSAEVVRAGEFFVMARTNFLKFLDDHAQPRMKVTRMIGALYRRSLKEREDVALRPVPERLAEFLLRHACVRQTNGSRVLIHATQADIAARLGTVREVVARIFADFEQRGIIGRGDSAVFVADWNGLHAEAGVESPEADETVVRAGARTPSMRRTARFFLPTIERMRRHEDADEVARCSAFLGDLAACRDKQCPGALEAAGRRAAK